jgi:hypothetical protein
MSWLKISLWVSLTGLTLASAPAQTLTLTLDSLTPMVAFNGHAGNGNFNAYAGLLNFTVTAETGTAYEPADKLSLFCVELQQHISLPSTGNVYSLVNAAQASSGINSGYSANIPLAGIGSARVRNLEVLYGHVFGPSYNPGALTNIQKSAFQLAVWELSHDDGFNLTSGNGQHLWITSTGSTVNQAKTWVDWVAANYNNASTPYMELSALHSSTTQDFLIPSASSFSAIPEPSFSVLLAGLGAIPLLAWRRKLLASA